MTYENHRSIWKKWFFWILGLNNIKFIETGARPSERGRSPKGRATFDFDGARPWADTLFSLGTGIAIYSKPDLKYHLWKYCNQVSLLLEYSGWRYRSYSLILICFFALFRCFEDRRGFRVMHSRQIVLRHSESAHAVDEELFVGESFEEVVEADFSGF